MKEIITHEIERLSNPFQPKENYPLTQTISFILSHSKVDQSSSLLIQIEKEESIQNISSLFELLPLYYIELTSNWLFEYVKTKMNSEFNREQFHFVFGLFESAKKYNYIALLIIWLLDNTKGFEWEICVPLKLHYHSFAFISQDHSLSDLQKKISQKVSTLI